MSKPEFKLIKNQHSWSVRYNVADRHLKASFEINSEGKITFYDGWGSNNPKDFHFEDSNPAVVVAIANLLKACVKQAKEVLEIQKNLAQNANKTTSPTLPRPKKGKINLTTSNRGQKSPSLPANRVTKQGSAEKIAKKTLGQGSAK